MFEMATGPRNDLLCSGLAAFRTCNRNTDYHADTVPIPEELPVSVKLAFLKGGPASSSSSSSSSKLLGPRRRYCFIAGKVGSEPKAPKSFSPPGVGILGSVRQSCKPDTVKGPCSDSPISAVWSKAIRELLCGTFPPAE
ncbi:uncharacterized protein FTOL_09153 [Fusarium torulosum]|uniref:Uncharacterized protein n=1 Tax=Fusarium torulosum TaxID=33205 RepID=A0AAE8MGG5_9HYPO|nr:uncharacterized protein FTOL_09153 [Fusarium torulosum]